MLPAGGPTAAQLALSFDMPMGVATRRAGANSAPGPSPPVNNNPLAGLLAMLGGNREVPPAACPAPSGSANNNPNPAGAPLPQAAPVQGGSQQPNPLASLLSMVGASITRGSGRQCHNNNALANIMGMIGPGSECIAE